MTIIVMIISIIVGTGSLAFSFWRAGFANPALWLMALGVIWLLAHWRRFYWFSAIALFLMVFAAAFGVWRGFPAAWMLLGALGGLLGWDLSEFAVHRRYAAPTDDIDDMERHHLARVGVVAMLGMGLAALSLVIHVKRLAFEVAVGLILFAALGLTRLVARLRKF